nr:MAG TPA: hypothetical protein [Caudoviricetes sp.]
MNDGSQIVPENQAESAFLQHVANNPTRTDEEKEHIAKMGALLGPDKFDLDFTVQQRAQLPTELDEPLRRMIREV